MNKADLLKSIKSQRRLIEDAVANLATIEKIAKQLPDGTINTAQLKSALDSAFLRRLRFVVEFPFPAPAEQRKMWEMVSPQSHKNDHTDDPLL